MTTARRAGQVLADLLRQVERPLRERRQVDHLELEPTQAEHPHVGDQRSVRVVGRLGGGAGQLDEHRRLADVGQTDERDLRFSHLRRSRFP